MNKTIIAFLKGYIFFKVNSKSFLLYNNALAERKSITKNVTFIGFHVLRGWETFFYRHETRIHESIMIPVNNFEELAKAIENIPSPDVRFVDNGIKE